MAAYIFLLWQVSFKAELQVPDYYLEKKIKKIRAAIPFVMGNTSIYKLYIMPNIL